MKDGVEKGKGRVGLLYCCTGDMPQMSGQLPSSTKAEGGTCLPQGPEFRNIALNGLQQLTRNLFGTIGTLSNLIDLSDRA